MVMFNSMLLFVLFNTSCFYLNYMLISFLLKIQKLLFNITLPNVKYMYF